MLCCPRRAVNLSANFFLTVFTGSSTLISVARLGDVMQKDEKPPPSAWQWFIKYEGSTTRMGCVYALMIQVIPTQTASRQKVFAVLYAMETYHKQKAAERYASRSHRMMLGKLEELFSGQREEVISRLDEAWTRIRLEKPDDAETVSAFMSYLHTALDAL